MTNNKLATVLTAVLATVLVLALSTVLTVPAMAADLVLKDTIELRTRSVLMVDRSGSMEEQEAVNELLEELDLESFDVVVYFDHRISRDSNFSGGGDSYICQTFDKLAKAGFTHITILTDGQQHPQRYDSLGVYPNLDVTVQLVESTKESTDFIYKLKDALVRSNLTVINPEGGAAMILMEYEPPIYEVEFVIPEEELPATPEESEATEPEFSAENYASEEENSEVSDTIVVTSDDKSDGKCYWWVALILAVVIAALFDFIHELLTKKDNGKNSNNSTTTAKKMATAIAVDGAHVVADFSGSMADVQALTAHTCQQVNKGKKNVICFGESVFEAPADELANIPAQGQTAGWEALELANQKGWEEIVLVSDLEFNGKTFDNSVFVKNFKKVTIVTPPVYKVKTLQDIKKIADEVEVLYL